jgi:hypothetical protein
MSLFSKKINEITFDDVVDFCKLGICEGINLDYKRGFTDKLENTISSFANSYGGLIIIGVNEENSRPKEPFIGIDFDRGLEERIWSIILDNIYPPIFPEIFICPPKNGKTFAIIRIQESDITPHAIYNKTKVYIRTGNITHLEELATLNQLEWLFEKRKKSIDLKREIINKAETRADNISLDLNNLVSPKTTVIYCPVHPYKPLANYDELEKIFTIIRDIDLSISFYFPETAYEFTPNQNGIYSFYKEDSYFNYFEINNLGLLFNKGNINKNNVKEISILEILRLLRNSLVTTYYLYKNLSFKGLFEFSLKIENIKDCKILRPNQYFQQGNIPIENEICWKRILNIMKMDNENYFIGEFKNLFKEILWSLGERVKDIDLNSVIEKNVIFKKLIKV